MACKYWVGSSVDLISTLSVKEWPTLTNCSLKVETNPLLVFAFLHVQLVVLMYS